MFRVSDKKIHNHAASHPLRNAVNDAQAVTDALSGRGFEVESYKNFTLAEMESAARKFVGGLHPGNVALIYYAGHGMQVDGGELPGAGGFRL